MTDTVAPEPTPEQAALFARVRRMMLIAGLTSALAVAVVLIAVGYRLYRGEGSPTPAVTDVTATLAKGAPIGSAPDAAERRPDRLDRGRRRAAGGDARYGRGDRNPDLRRQDAQTRRKAQVLQRTLKSAFPDKNVPAWFDR